jgi:hypothetical protein
MRYLFVLSLLFVVGCNSSDVEVLETDVFVPETAVEAVVEMQEEVLDEVILEATTEEVVTPSTNDFAENNESETLTSDDAMYSVDIELSGTKDEVKAELNSAVDEALDVLQ